MKFFLVILFIIGAIVFILSFRKSFKVAVYAAECRLSPITIGEGAVTRLGNVVLHTIISAPTEEADRMMNELGALVRDLQEQGDNAIENWKM